MNKMLTKDNKNRERDYVAAAPKRSSKTIPCLEFGKPVTEAVWIKARSWREAIQKAQKGQGVQFTKEEAALWVDDDDDI